jgi:hypothetical protein
MNKIKILLLVFTAGALLHACRPEPFKQLNERTGNINALNGSWQLMKVTQIDADAQRKGFPYQSLDLTNVLPYNQFKMAFNVINKTFTTTPGNAPRIINLASGNWSADNNEAPKLLTLVNGTDTARITLGAYPNSVNSNLRLRQERKDASGKVLIIYDYEFVKQ